MVLTNAFLAVMKASCIIVKFTVFFTLKKVIYWRFIDVQNDVPSRIMICLSIVSSCSRASLMSAHSVHTMNG